MTIIGRPQETGTERKGHINNRRGSCMINGVFYPDSMGCEAFPSCFACGYEDGCHRDKKTNWQGVYPKCLKWENCLECVTKKCVLNGGAAGLTRSSELAEDT